MTNCQTTLLRRNGMSLISLNTSVNEYTKPEVSKHRMRLTRSASLALTDSKLIKNARACQGHAICNVWTCYKFHFVSSSLVVAEKPS
jgi:hypothetical protein